MACVPFAITHKCTWTLYYLLLHPGLNVSALPSLTAACSLSRLCYRDTILSKIILSNDVFSRTGSVISTPLFPYFMSIVDIWGRPCMKTDVNNLYFLRFYGTYKSRNTIHKHSCCLKVHLAILKIGHQVMRKDSPRMLFKSAATGVIREMPKLQSESQPHYGGSNHITKPETFL